MTVFQQYKGKKACKFFAPAFGLLGRLWPPAFSAERTLKKEALHYTTLTVPGADSELYIYYTIYISIRSSAWQCMTSNPTPEF